MAEVKVGSRLRSSVCSTEVMVVAGPGGEADLRCGGAGMIPVGEEPEAGLALDAGASGGTALGKRYVDADGSIEVLCTKPGEGSLALGDAALTLKEAKALPSSD